MKLKTQNTQDTCRTFPNINKQCIGYLILPQKPTGLVLHGTFGDRRSLSTST